MVLVVEHGLSVRDAGLADLRIRIFHLQNVGEPSGSGIDDDSVMFVWPVNEHQLARVLAGVGGNFGDELEFIERDGDDSPLAILGDRASPPYQVEQILGL